MRFAPEVAAPVAAGTLLAVLLAAVFAGRLGYPFDLEWMEGGMLAHAWRLQRGLPLYAAPNPDFVPFVYPPGYPALVAALGVPFGLSLPLGRAVSLVATLAAGAAVAFGARREHADRPALLPLFALVFVGTFPQAGAFYDLVRPDALGLALAAWAIVLVREEGRHVPWVAGLLLAGACLVKQSFVVFAAPLALGFGLRDLRAGAAFLATLSLPTAGIVAALEASSGGAFSTWLLDVPASHPRIWERAWLDTPREWGLALPVVFGALGFAAVARAPKVVGLGAVWVGAAAATGGLLAAPPEAPPAWAVVYGALGALPIAALSRPPERGAVVDFLVVASAAAGSVVMRVHESGYTNVHAPLFWCLSLVFARTSSRWTGPALALQLLWSAGQLDRRQLVPTADDEAAGRRFVEELRKVDGDILSPFSAWTPTYVGRPPSVHAMGIWDANVPDGPYVGDLSTIADALRQHRWAAYATSRMWMFGDPARYYAPAVTIVEPDSDVFVPPTGYRARPTAVYLPRR